jgi:hypothetical protein
MLNIRNSKMGFGASTKLISNNNPIGKTIDTQFDLRSQDFEGISLRQPKKLRPKRAGLNG